MKAEAVAALLRGRVVVCMASGPSLTAEDVELVRAAGAPTIVTNTTFQLAPWATVLVAHDPKWWETYADEVAETFAGLKASSGPAKVKRLGAVSLMTLMRFKSFSNSGAAAVALAVVSRARRVVMLGYDCQRTDGRTHWHGDHPENLSNARSLPLWPQKFERLAAYARNFGVPVVNASRATALQCFPRVELEDELAALNEGIAA